MSTDIETNEKKGFWKTLPGIATAIGGILTAATGLIVAVNSLKSSSPKQETEQTTSTKAKTEIVNQQFEISVAIAEKMTNDFINAFKSQNIDAIMSLVSIPFFNDHNIKTSMSEVRIAFQTTMQEKAGGSFPEVNSIKVRTVKEWKDAGILNENDRILKSLNISDDDYYSSVELGKDALAIAFRIVDHKLKIAGIWD
jgi:hypothetical protein